MDKIYLWIDKIAPTGLAAETSDIKKIYHNFDLIGTLGEEIQQRINIKLLFENSVQAIFSLGRFICVVKLNKNDSEGIMLIFDFRVYSEEKWKEIAYLAYPNNVVQFMKSYEEALSSSLSEDFGLVELSEFLI
jgi:hypothetical protein